ncbi:hypothetical protein H4R20_005575 [Coemansia guatemalensis]|uniref:Uncharacterized protein n=1 Tax=Coemansia guatemalensis TaxID=2761395 RepID=A0A9W8HRF9_9FUNG|nr:hypothetical protein H4R20_005575 [Coemansia guatemalensis]
MPFLTGWGLEGENRNVPKTVLGTLALLNAILGAYLGAFGAYLIATSDIEFSNHWIPLGIIMLGLIAIYASDIATTGILSSSRAHIQNVAFIGALIVLGELLLIVHMAWVSMKSEQNLYKSWTRIFNTNPLSLQHVEHYYGCCGFSDKDDMPSRSNCLKELDNSEVDGCAGYLAQTAFDKSRMAMIRCTVAMLLQILFLVIGWALVERVLEPDTTWLVDDDVNPGGNWAAGTAPAITTPAAAVGESQNAPEAHKLNVADDGLVVLVGGVQSEDAPATGNAAALASTSAGVAQQGDDTTYAQETSMPTDDSTTK